MNYDNDLRELISLIEMSDYSETDDYEVGLRSIAEEVDEEYLAERATKIQEEAVKSERMRNALSRISPICSNDKTNCRECPVSKYCNSYIAFVRNNKNFRHNMVDLFCGAGGLSLGFTQEDFYTVLANDIEECCVDTYAHNHPETPRDHIVLGDIRLVTDHLEQLVGGEEIDVVVGGPPCQGFSMANRQRLIDDPRNHLYKSYVEIVSRVKPKFFVMENVRGMLSVANQVREDFEKIGYSVSYYVLNAKDFGVPQNRERLIYIGNRIGVNNEELFAELRDTANNSKEYLLRDAIYGLKPLQASRTKNSTDLENDKIGRVIDKTEHETNEYIELINGGRKVDYVFNHKARFNNDRDIEIFGRLNQGDRSDDSKIADIMPYARRNGIFKDKYYKLEEDKVCKTITAHMKFDCNMYIHPTQARGLSPREAARVQSYPDDYFFRGAYTKTYMQIGNSVPPLLGRAIAKVIRRRLEET